MPLFVHEYKPKPASFSNHCMHLPELLKNACTQCHGSCLSRTSSLSSADDDDDGGSDIDLDNKYVNCCTTYLHILALFVLLVCSNVYNSSLPQAIIMEIRSRAMKAKLTTEEVLLPREHMIMNKEEKGGEECAAVDDDDDSDEGSESFFSVKSCFSRCSSNEYIMQYRKRSILEDFRHCEGWPFGLCRRALVPPPLPSPPSDSWQWHKRKLVSKTC